MTHPRMCLARVLMMCKCLCGATLEHVWRSELGATTGGAGGVNAPAAADAEWQQLHLSPFDAVEQPGAEPLALKARPL